jgi:hypothetical protein
MNIIPFIMLGISMPLGLDFVPLLAIHSPIAKIASDAVNHRWIHHRRDWQFSLLSKFFYFL